MPATTRLRRVRHVGFTRLERQKKINRFLLARQVALAGTGASATFVGSVGNNITWTGHAKAVGAGPFSLTTTGVLPTGLNLTALYWIQSVVDVNTVTLTTKRGGPVSSMSAIGSGTHTIAKSSTLNAMFEYNKQVGPTVLSNCIDVDTL